MIKKLGLQLYTLRDYFKDADFAALTFRKMAELGYTEAHTAGNYGFTPEEFGKLASDNGVKIIGTHFNYDTIINDSEETIRVHKLWDTTNIGIGGMPVWARESLDNLKKFIDEFNRAAEVYAKEGFKLTYHHHHFEFLRIDGNKTIMDLLYENLDPKNTSFVLDTCWIHAGCSNLNEWMEKLAGRIDILHLKDVMLKMQDNQMLPTMTEVGNGFVHWDSVIEIAERIGVKHYVVEQDGNFANGNPFDSIKASAKALSKYIEK